MHEPQKLSTHKSLLRIAEQAFMFRRDMLLFNVMYIGRTGQVALGTVLGVILFASFFTLQTQLSVTAQVNSQFDHKVGDPISIKLGQYVRPPESFSIVPEVAGKWSSEGSIKTGTTMHFRPTSGQLPADTSYTINIAGIKRITGQTVPAKTITIKSEAAKGVKSFEPVAAAKVSRNSAVTLTLDGQNNGVRKLRAKFTPTFSYSQKTENDSIFSWVPNEPLKQGAKYSVAIYDDNALSKNPIATTEFAVHPAPAFSIAERRYYYPGEALVINFDKPMNKAEKVVDGLKGSGEWKSDTQYQFIPSNITVAQKYSFNVVEGLSARDDSVIEAAVPAVITTPGTVVASFGGVSANSDTKQVVSINFDQPVNRKTAEERFSISPNVEGSISWRNDSTMIFAPKGYDQQTVYRLTIAPGVLPIQFGLPGQGNASSFTTKAVEFRLNVPLYRQQHVSSCEAASLRMALAYRGIYKNDIEIVQTFGYNPRYIDTSTNSWDDPNEMYVGDVNGLQSKLHGYGAHAAPVAKGARSYGRDATAHFNIGVNFIAEQILAGNPVIIIGTAGAGNARRVTWNGPNGVVEAWYGEHARTVVGVVGKASSPVGFIVHDPLVSKPLYWTPAQLQRDIDATPQVPSQVVVVR